MGEQKMHASGILADGTDEAALLREFLIGDTDLLLLADNHLLHIRQLIAWVDS